MLKRNLAVLVLGAVVLGGGAFAWAQTSDGSPSAPTTAAPNAQQPGPQGRNGNRPGRAGILRRVVHGDLIVRGKDGKALIVGQRSGDASQGQGNQS